MFVRKGIAFNSLIVGGAQEKGMRAGTENVPGIVGLGKAVEICTRDILANSKKVRDIREYFISQVKEKIELTYLNGHPIQRLPNNINLSFGMVDGESLMCMLDLNGIAVSTGSACSSGSTEASHVLTAMGVPADLVQGAIRFSISKSTSKQDIDFVVEKLVDCVAKLRKISAMQKSQVGKGE